MFAVYKGFPHPIMEKGLFESESKKNTRILPGGTAVSVGAFGSFDETFYRSPFPISPEDKERIVEIVEQCVPAAKTANPLAAENIHQADYKIVHCQGGFGYNLHIYPRLKGIVLFRSNGSGGPLHLSPDLFKKLVAILDRYEVGNR